MSGNNKKGQTLRSARTFACHLNQRHFNLIIIKRRRKKSRFYVRMSSACTLTDNPAGWNFHNYAENTVSRTHRFGGVEEQLVSSIFHSFFLSFFLTISFAYWAFWVYSSRITMRWQAYHAMIECFLSCVYIDKWER